MNPVTSNPKYHKDAMTAWIYALENLKSTNIRDLIDMHYEEFVGYLNEFTGQGGNISAAVKHAANKLAAKYPDEYNNLTEQHKEFLKGYYKQQNLKG